MILVAGGTGRLGTHVVHLLTARGLHVRVLTRASERAKHLAGPLVETAIGDVGERSSVDAAMVNVETVVSAIHGFAGPGKVSPEVVDRQGNHRLIEAAEAAGVEHFVLISIQGASPNHPMDLLRAKYRAEQELRASKLSWTILRPTAYMETWLALIGQPLIRTGQTRVFGRGDNPINFVSVHDVAEYAVLAVVDPALRGRIVEIGGPDNLTFREVVAMVRLLAGASGTSKYVPRGMMRALALLLKPLQPALARQIQAGVVMDTADMTFDAEPARTRSPTMPHTSLADVVRREYGA